MQQIKAYAKLNLFLQLIGKRPDGYHLLESAIVFTDICDTLTLTPSSHVSLTITGSHADRLEIQDNLVLRAAQALISHVKNPTLAVAITLDKHIPLGAGLGGGSADAAAILQGLNQYWGLQLPENVLGSIGQTLGADIPVCLYGKSALVSGVGEQIAPLVMNQTMHMLLVNPNQILSTADVFKRHSLPWSKPLSEPVKSQVMSYITALRNDLTDAAISFIPEIQTIMTQLLRQPGCKLARMSGSGATCFGWFENQIALDMAADTLMRQYPDWWVRGCQVVGR